MEVEVIAMSDQNGASQANDEELRIVVGVDGSDGANRALDFAVHEARRWGALLHVISVFALPPVGGMATMAMDPFEDASGEILDSALARATELEPTVVTKGESHYGTSQQILIGESKGAALLVVGSRGRGEFKSLVLGSVSEDCAHHAKCPVTIVH
jgi:nucleotide-binding universal stress UspA family protein